MLTVLVQAQPTDFSGFDFSKVGRVLLALSGGSDSTALLHLFHRHWTGRLGRPVSGIYAATIDHGVRKEAQSEAAAVAAWCHGLGIEHQTLKWDGGVVSSGFQSAAREARYGKLSDRAKDLDVNLVLTGHTFNDQQETVLMRAKRKPDGRGVAGIAPATLHARTVWFARPLLNAPREALRQFLSLHDLQWFDDPSNEDPRYERVRVRHGDETSSNASISASAEAVRLRQSEACLAASWLDDSVRLACDPSGRLCAHLARCKFGTEGSTIGIAYLMMLVGMQSHVPPLPVIARAMRALEHSQRCSFTAAGCVLERIDAQVRVAPETRNIRKTGFGLDHLLPIWDLPILDAFDRLRGLEPVSRPLFCRFG